MAILTAIWGRPRLTNLFLGFHRHVGQERLAVLSNKEYRLYADFPEWIGMNRPNKPLADKWNKGMQKASERDLDAVMILGSDDFVSPEYVDGCMNLLGQGKDLILPRHLHYYDTATKRAMRIRHEKPGAGRVLSRKLLDKLGWEPWRRGDENIDGSMDKRIKELAPETEYAFLDTGIVLDVKTSENMWSYDYLRKGAFEDMDADHLLNQHFPTIANQLLNWNE